MYEYTAFFELAWEG